MVCSDQVRLSKHPDPNSCAPQTSLAQFNGLYSNAIDTAERAALPAKYIANIISTLTWNIYLYVTRGLYENHKLVFALMLTNKVLLTAGKVWLHGKIQHMCYGSQPHRFLSTWKARADMAHLYIAVMAVSCITCSGSLCPWLQAAVSFQCRVRHASSNCAV